MSTTDFYTYELAYPESLGGATFYVGKGIGKRWLDHEREARGDVQSRKCDVIRFIWACGEQVERRKIHEHLSEEQAFFHEARLINAYGWMNLVNEQRGYYSLLPLEECPLPTKSNDQYALTWTGSSNEVIRVEARKHFFRVHLIGKSSKQVFSLAQVIETLGRENITQEQVNTLATMQTKFRADHS